MNFLECVSDNEQESQTALSDKLFAAPFELWSETWNELVSIDAS